MGKLTYTTAWKSWANQILLHYTGNKFEDERIHFAEFGFRKAKFYVVQFQSESTKIRAQ